MENFTQVRVSLYADGIRLAGQKREERCLMARLYGLPEGRVPTMSTTANEIEVELLTRGNDLLDLQIETAAEVQIVVPPTSVLYRLSPTAAEGRFKGIRIGARIEGGS